MQHSDGPAAAPSGRGAESGSAPSLWRRWGGHGIRLTFWSLLALTLLFVGAIALTRFWLVPNVDSFRPRLVEELTRITRQRVVIGGIEAGWNGWSPEFHLTRLQLLDARGRTLLQLPEVNATLSWRSLFLFEPRLTALSVRGPRVIVRRTAENALTVAGFDVDLSNTTEGDSGIVDWLLKQRMVQITAGEIEWQDEWRKLPALRLASVNVRLYNDGGRHQFGLTAVPPSELAAPLDLRAEFTGSDARHLSDWDGLAYVRADYANLAELSRYFPLPVQMARGEGALQAWFEFDDGQPVAVTTDLVARNARLQLLPLALAAPGARASAAAATARATALDLGSLRGRLSWRVKTLSGGSGANTNALTQQRWSARDLHASGAGDLRLPAANAEVVLDYRGDDIIGGAVRAPRIELAAAAPFLKTLPLPAAFVERWLALQPTGSLDEVDLRWRDEGESAPLGRFSVEGSVALQRVGWRGEGGVPGVAGLDARLSGSTQAGELRLEVGDRASPRAGRDETKPGPSRSGTSAPLRLDFGTLFETAMSFDTARGTVSWKREAAPDGRVAMHIAARDMEAGNADALAQFSGTWDRERAGPGVANFSGTLLRADATAVHRYLPTTIDAATRHYLRDAIGAGDARNGRFTVKGDLSHFPFANDQHGVFEIAAPVTGGVFTFDSHWPRAEAIATELVFRGSGMSGHVTSAAIGGIPIANTDVKIADMAATPAVLDIKGGASGAIDDFLRFAATTPVNGWLDGFLGAAHGTGNARLAMSLTMPLDDATKTRLAGEFTMPGNTLALGGDVPALASVQGKLRFTMASLASDDIAAEAFGGPLRLTLATREGRIEAHARGSARLEKLREQFPFPLVDRLSGPATWELDLRQPRTASASSVGKPEKAAADEPVLQLKVSATPERWPLDAILTPADARSSDAKPISATVRRTLLDGGRDAVTLEVPGQLHAVAERSAPTANATRTIERAVLDLGATASALPARGYAVRGDVARFNADATMELIAEQSGAAKRSLGGATAEATRGEFIDINLRAGEAVLYGHRFHDVSLRAQPSGQRWRLALKSREASGVIALDTDAASGAVDAVAIRLQRLTFPTPVTATSESAAASSAATRDASNRWPKLDLVADSFVSDGRELGKLEIRAQPAADEWRIDQVKLTNADGSIDAKGRWRTVAATPPLPLTGDTNVDVTLRWNDAGRFMQRFGLPKGVERAAGSLTGNVGWPGSPAQFSYARLGGRFTLETAAGRFTEMEPGIAKLLGVLSLQSLPRRLSFNFDDLFGKGFAFDEVKADVSIADGIARTDGFAINGPSARVQLRGSADINRETQDVQVRVFPSISTATAVGVGLVTANPMLGAAVLLGQKLARDPLERMLMQEFDVKGTWSNPEVKPVGRSSAGEDPTARASPPGR